MIIIIIGAVKFYISANRYSRRKDKKGATRLASSDEDEDKMKSMSKKSGNKKKSRDLDEDEDDNEEEEVEDDAKSFILD